MGFSIGNVFGSVVKALKPIATAALQAASGPAINLLKNIVGSGFDGVKNFATTGIASALPGPLGALASKLLGSGIDKLKNLATGGLEKGLTALVNKFFPRQVDGQNVTTPTLPGRAGALTTTQSAVAASANAVGGNTWDSQMAGTVPGTPDSKQLIKDLKAKYPGLKDEDAAMMAAQEQMQAYQRMIMTITSIIQAKHEASKAIIQNFRV